MTLSPPSAPAPRGVGPAAPGVASRPVGALILRPAVIRRAAVMALIVGPVLAAINHGDRMIAGTWTGTDLLKIALTFLVPYTVSSVSSIMAIREQDRARGHG